MKWGCRLRKTAFTAPLYISLAWSLIISYQVFTQTAVYSVVDFLGNSWPSASGFLISRIDTIAFIHAFAWIFVLSSVIPLLILGRGRSVLLQFFLCLTMTFVAVSVEELLTLVTGAEPTIQMQTLSIWFQNPLVAGFYLSVPYLFMLFLERMSRKERRQGEKLDDRDGKCRRENLLAKQGVFDSAESENKGGINFLHGASAVFFLLAVFTFWFSGIISGTFLTMAHTLVYIALFLTLGIILLVLAFYSTSTKKQVFKHLSEATLKQKLYEQAEPPEKEAAEDSTEQLENLMENQIQEQHYRAQPQIRRYDVRHPRDIIDSQC